jgi:predicted 3-demethylubiquinone-9 3-methyltransferase (glyoxalase superfamily)
MTAKIRTCFWFDREGEAAAAFYVSLLPDSRVESVFRPEPNGPALTVDFTLAGTPYQILNGGPQFPQTVAASISVLTEDQAETDRLWAALIADGGDDSKCGWLKDRWGVSWQIVPKALPRLLGSSNRAASGRVMQALMSMQKIDVAALEAAARDLETA